VKGRDLYDFYFKQSDHQKFATFLNERKFRWVLSYDDDSAIHELYSHKERNILFMNYFVHAAKVGREVIISSGNCDLPNWRPEPASVPIDEAVRAHAWR
jgi:hypothetical protein